MSTRELMLFSGSSIQELSANVASELGTHLGRSIVGRFSDGEISVAIEENVRGFDIFLLQSTCTPTNDNIMELMLMADALRRASAQRITAVLPYFGYGRQDRRVRSARVPISGKVVADMLSAVGIDRLLTVDLHADQIQGFFNVPVDNVYGSPVLVSHALSRGYHNPVVVSPDVGGVVRARAIAKQLNDIDIAIIDKRRDRANEISVMNVLGEVHSRTALLIDDMVDTAGTLCNAADALKAEGATHVAAYITHPVLSGSAIERITDSKLDELVVTDTIPLTEKARSCSKILQLSMANLLAEAIRRVSNAESLSAMFRE